MQSIMRTQLISADSIDEVAGEILGLLKENTYHTRTVSSRDNVFYFDGWDGLGASAVLRAIAKRLATTSADGKRALAEQEFDQVIHIDCSMWGSRRALQKAVAEQLELPSEVMELFDKEDEEDDFRGVAQGERAEVQQVVREMQQHILKLNRRFLVIFHNGSSEEVDLASCCGLPLSGFSTSKVLWTFQGRFRLKPRTKVDAAVNTTGTTDVLLGACELFKKREELWPYLVLQETAEVAAACKVNTGSRGIIDQPEQVTECFLYIWDLCCSGGQLIGYDLDTHGANYWVCDDIIRHPQQGDGDGLWRAAEALHREIRLDMDAHQYVPSSDLLGPWQIRSKPYWTSPTYGLILIPARATPNGDMFQHCADKLSVLKLSRCTLDFQEPPFLCCHSLRFLWLDHCQGTRTSTQGGAAKEDDIRRCFQRMWVLDVRHTDCDHILSAQMLALMTQLRELHVTGANGWDMGQLQGRLPNIRKLRVKNSEVSCSCPENDLFSKMNKMEHLDFSGNKNISSMTSLFGPGVSSSSSVWCLETVDIVEGCQEVQQISFRGCTELKNLRLGGWMWHLRILDISGTAVKALDLRKTEIPYLDELYLLDCKKLCAILWPPKDKMKEEGLSKLCIDTTWSAPTTQSREEKAKRGTSTSTATTGTSVPPAATPHGSEFDWYICVRDARLLGSLGPVYSDSREAYVEISSPPPHPTVAVGGSKDEGIFKSASSGEHQLLVNLQRQPARAAYTDISVDRLQQASEGGADTLGIMWVWPCPDVPDLPEKRCYMHIQDQMKTNIPGGGEEASTILVPEFVTYKCAKILHVHDSPSITRTNSDKYGSEWPSLEWCRIERCPKLEFVFNNVQGSCEFYQLRIFWASQLLKSRYISTSNGLRAFLHLTLLHLDFCPRLIHVLPFTTGWFTNFKEHDKDSLCLLETLEIAWCSDLREIFPFNNKGFKPRPNSKDFPRLKRIHLHELPSLQHICGVRMSTPNLESVKIRGCWSLTRLPDVGGSSSKVVECDCEKEWWDRLEWDDGSQANNYRPIHPRYYKKTMLRGSVLR